MEIFVKLNLMSYWPYVRTEKLYIEFSDNELTIFPPNFQIDTVNTLVAEILWQGGLGAKEVNINSLAGSFSI